MSGWLTEAEYRAMEERGYSLRFFDHGKRPHGLLRRLTGHLRRRSAPPVADNPISSLSGLDLRRLVAAMVEDRAADVAAQARLKEMLRAHIEATPAIAVAAVKAARAREA